MEHTEAPMDKCPYCGHSADTFTDIDGTYKPKPGDISLCLYCQEIGIINKEMKTDKLPDGFIERLSTEGKNNIKMAKRRAFLAMNPDKKSNF